MWEKPNTEQYLSVIAKYFEVHATIGTTKRKNEVLNWSSVPMFVSNHGILNGAQLKELLRVSVCVCVCVCVFVSVCVCV